MNGTVRTAPFFVNQIRYDNTTPTVVPVSECEVLASLTEAVTAMTTHDHLTTSVGHHSRSATMK